MVKLNGLLVLAVCSFGVTSASLARGPLPAKPEQFKNVEGCYINETNSMIKFGESVAAPVGLCYEIQCSSNSIVYAYCGTVGTSDPQCYVTKHDLTRPHPDCCPTVKCDSNELL